MSQQCESDDRTGRRTGKVVLVGAGPGDPGLITVRGVEVLRFADVVVYDRLATPSLLSHCRGDAKLIYVGKGPGGMKQLEINALLVEEASAGRYVCRLKGGDPFLFGRGGEGFVRLNFGCPRSMLVEALNKMKEALFALR